MNFTNESVIEYTICYASLNVLYHNLSYEV